METRKGKMGVEEEVVVTIIDNGENYPENGEGKTPNHDKIEIDYSAIE